MEAYQSFAKLYDLFMDGVPYDAWCEQTQRLLGRFGITEGIVAELGCGTGNCTERLAAAGFDMIGIDNAEEMLEEAMQKKLLSGSNSLYLCQDMREFELYGTCRAMISRCDSMNYLCTAEDLREVFRLVNNYLDPGGIFLFDMNTVYKYEHLLADNIFAETREEGSFIWENHYDGETRENIYDMTFYLRETEALFRRSEETHVQRAYTLEEVRREAEAAGLIFLEAMDAETESPLIEESERMLILLREHGKEA
jgi:methyltransferase domain